MLEIEEVQRIFESAVTSHGSIPIEATSDGTFVVLVAVGNDRSFELRTNGAEAFVSVLDCDVSRIDFEYDRSEQTSLVTLLGQLARSYLQGSGTWRARRSFFGKRRDEFVITLNGEEFVFTKRRV